VISGKDGKLIRTHEGNEFGVLAVNLGDLDGDKVEDYGMIHCDPTLEIEVFSGKSGKPLFSRKLAQP